MTPSGVPGGAAVARGAAGAAAGSNERRGVWADPGAEAPPAPPPRPPSASPEPEEPTRRQPTPRWVCYVQTRFQPGFQRVEVWYARPEAWERSVVWVPPEARSTWDEVKWCVRDAVGLQPQAFRLMDPETGHQMRRDEQICPRELDGQMAVRRVCVLPARP